MYYAYYLHNLDKSVLHQRTELRGTVLGQNRSICKTLTSRQNPVVQMSNGTNVIRAQPFQNSVTARLICEGHQYHSSTLEDCVQTWQQCTAPIRNISRLHSPLHPSSTHNSVGNCQDMCHCNICP